MDPHREPRAIDDRQVLEFFVAGLQDVSEPNVAKKELLYNASVLAHYAQVSTHTASDLPTPATLGVVFDHFVLDTTLHQDSEMLEAAGAQCLLLAGFFEDQMRDRHNIGYFSALGAGFYSRAASRSNSRHRSSLLDTISHHFEPWRRRHARLSRELRDRVYLLIPPSPPAIM
jgi:hypothetical protein